MWNLQDVNCLAVAQLAVLEVHLWVFDQPLPASLAKAVQGLITTKWSMYTLPSSWKGQIVNLSTRWNCRQFSEYWFCSQECLWILVVSNTKRILTSSSIPDNPMNPGPDGKLHTVWNEVYYILHANQRGWCLRPKLTLVKRIMNRSVYFQFVQWPGCVGLSICIPESEKAGLFLWYANLLSSVQSVSFYDGYMYDSEGSLSGSLPTRLSFLLWFHPPGLSRSTAPSMKQALSACLEPDNAR